MGQVRVPLDGNGMDWDGIGWNGMGCVASLATLKLGVLIVRDGDGGVVWDSFVVVEGWASMRRRYEHVVPGE